MQGSGCIKCSEGCQNCYMYYLDRVYVNGGSSVVKKTSGFRKYGKRYHIPKKSVQSEMAYNSGAGDTEGWAVRTAFPSEL